MVLCQRFVYKVTWCTTGKRKMMVLNNLFFFKGEVEIGHIVGSDYLKMKISGVGSRVFHS